LENESLGYILNNLQYGLESQIACHLVWMLLQRIGRVPENGIEIICIEDLMLFTQIALHHPWQQYDNIN